MLSTDADVSQSQQQDGHLTKTASLAQKLYLTYGLVQDLKRDSSAQH